jgi:hypothetical protein
MLHGQKYTSDEEVEDAEDKWLCIKKKNVDGIIKILDQSNKCAEKL